MAGWDDWNPFVRRDTHSHGSLVAYKVLTLLTWLVAVIVSVYYSVYVPHNNHHHVYIRRIIWDLNDLYRTAFTMNHIIAEVYWIVLFILQIGYATSLFSKKAEVVHAAASVSGHFIINNILHTIFVVLFVHSHFAIAEVILILNFLNLSSLYFRHNTTPRFIHVPVASGPLAWTFVAIYWNGAIMVPHPHTLVARIFGNVFIWAILGYGAFFIVAYSDYTMGFALSVLSAAIGVAQFKRQVIAFQWIFAFIIMALLFIMTITIAVPRMAGRDARWRRTTSADQERAPLLNESAT
ncbi:hypothetical protein ACHAQJ_006702 [Trichoderma viride]